MSSAMQNDMERAFRLWDTAMSMRRQHSATWGNMMRDEMRRFIDLADNGNRDALAILCRCVLKHVPKPEVSRDCVNECTNL